MVLCAPDFVWRAAGCPSTPKPVHDVVCDCALCACSVDRGVKIKDAIGTTFASHGELACQWSPYVCLACTWVLAGKPPNTIRQWTVLYREDRELANGNDKAPYLGPRVCLTSKNDLTELVELLLEPPTTPWIASVAVSGQKHVLPFAQVNVGSPWVVRFEAVDLPGDPDRFAKLLHAAVSLMAAGFYKSDVASGTPTTGRLIQIGIPFWKKHFEVLAPERGGHLLELALMCIRKDEEENVRKRAERFFVGR